MKYAVIKTGGKQYKVQEGQVLNVEKLNEEKDKKIEFDEVLLMVDAGKSKIGQPTTGSKVVAKVVDQIKGEKIKVTKFKAKTGYKKTIGHRQSLTKVLIEKISS